MLRGWKVTRGFSVASPVVSPLAAQQGRCKTVTDSHFPILLSGNIYCKEAQGASKSKEIGLFLSSGSRCHAHCCGECFLAHPLASCHQQMPPDLRSPFLPLLLFIPRVEHQSQRPSAQCHLQQEFLSLLRKIVIPPKMCRWIQTTLSVIWCLSSVVAE